MSAIDRRRQRQPYARGHQQLVRAGRTVQDPQDGLPRRGVGAATGVGLQSRRRETATGGDQVGPAEPSAPGTGISGYCGPPDVQRRRIRRPSSSYLRPSRTSGRGFLALLESQPQRMVRCRICYCGSQDGKPTTGSCRTLASGPGRSTSSLCHLRPLDIISNLQNTES